MFYNRPVYDTPGSFRRRKIRLINKSFQYRYTFYLLALIATALILFAGPIFYYLNQNYQLFMKLAYDTSPSLLIQLERESVVINSFLFISCITMLLGSLLLGIQVTAKLIGPLYVLEKHLLQLTKGNWSIHPVRTRHNDEFQELIGAYNYFYKSLQAQTQNEIKILKKLSIDPNNREAYRLWQDLIKTKSQQLDINSSDLDAALQPSPLSRHAS